MEQLSVHGLTAGTTSTVFSTVAKFQIRVIEIVTDFVTEMNGLRLVGARNSSTFSLFLLVPRNNIPLTAHYCTPGVPAHYYKVQDRR
jgi:hypothetical protein